VVSDLQAGLRLELHLSTGDRDRDPGDLSFLVHEQVGQLADATPSHVHVLADELGQGAASGTVEAELAVEQDERRGNGEVVVTYLAGREGQEAVRAVAAGNLEPDEAREGTVKQDIRGDPEAHVPDDDRPTDERSGPVQRPHPAVGMPDRRRRQTPELESE